MTTVWSSIYSLCSSTSMESCSVNHYTTKSTTATLFSSCKSLKKKDYELCTENLGCETGVVYTSSPELTSPTTPLHGGGDEKNEAIDELKRSYSAFPPPLTTLSGGDCIRMVCSREDGRLRLIPTRVPPPLKAERADGCLRLRLLGEPKATKIAGDKEEEEEGGEDDNGGGGGGGMYGRTAGGCKEEEVVGASAAMAVPWEALWVATS